MTEHHEDVSWPEWDADHVPQGSDDAVAASGWEHWEPCGIALSAQVCIGPGFGLRAGLGDEPTATARRSGRRGLPAQPVGGSYADSGNRVKRHRWLALAVGSGVRRYRRVCRLR